MFDAQTSAFVAQIAASLNALVPAGRGSRRLRHRGSETWGPLPGVVALRARPRANILRPDGALSMRLSRYESGLCVSVSRWQNLVVKIKELLQNARKALKVNKGKLRGFFAQKILDFFKDTFTGNHWKISKKHPQKACDL